MNMIEARQQFADARKWIKRSGAAAMLAWLEDETDFFSAPASAGHHGAFRGGLLVHSLNTYSRLYEIAHRDLGHNPMPEVEETVAILGLLHDVCKVGCYHEEEKRRRNPDTGHWEDYTGYTYRDPFPLGHGEKSLYLISRFMKLTDDEALAIRWHMGAYDFASHGTGMKTMSAAIAATPWVWRLQEADMCANYIDEQEAET